MQRRARAVAQRLRLRLGARRAADHRGGGDEAAFRSAEGATSRAIEAASACCPAASSAARSAPSCGPAPASRRSAAYSARAAPRSAPGPKRTPAPSRDRSSRERGAAARVARIELRRAPVRGERAGTVEPVTEPPPHSVVLEDPPQHPMPPRAPGLEVDRAARLRRRALAVPELEEREREVERVHRRARVRRREPAQLRERLLTWPVARSAAAVRSNAIRSGSPAWAARTRDARASASAAASRLPPVSST